jgi:hypothetical protein
MTENLLQDGKYLENYKFVINLLQYPTPNLPITNEANICIEMRNKILQWEWSTLFF